MSPLNAIDSRCPQHSDSSSLVLVRQQNVLYWIHGKGKRYRSFVANRIGEIQRQSNPEQLYYLESMENSADLCSRGLRATRLIESTLWWRGPDFPSKVKITDAKGRK